MGLIADIVGFFGKQADQQIETKEAPQVLINYTSNSYSKRQSFKDLADEGYKQNAIVYRCVNEIAYGAASIQFKIFQGDQQLEDHPLINLLNRPNPLQAGVEYFQSLYSYLLLSGNSYTVISDIDQAVQELHILRPDRIEIMPSNTSIPSGYKYKIDGRTIKVYEADPINGSSDVKHFKFWNPLDDYYGCSPLSAASMDIDQHNMVAKHNISLLQNGARPTGAIIFKPANDRGLPIQLTDGQRKQLYEDVQSKFSGPSNSGRPLLLEGDFDWREMGISPRDMDFISQKNMSARDIALCFGVPSQLVGIPDAQTYANIQEARLALYEETIIPLARRVESDFNEWLAPRYGDNILIQYDIDSIPAMVERRRRVYENVTQAVREGIITRNEARERLGLDSIQGGDDILIPANLFPLSQIAVSSPADTQEPEDAGKEAYGFKEEIEKDVFTTEAEAEARASEIGCIGTHSHEENGQTIYMPCASHDDYNRLTGETEQRSSKREVEKDVFTTEREARTRAEEIGCTGIHSHQGDDGTVFMPCGSHADYRRLVGRDLPTPSGYKKQVKDPRYGGGPDTFETVDEARRRAEELGCSGTHSVRSPDGTFYLPCSSHSIYLRVTGQDKYDEEDDDTKAESDVDTTPTDEMRREAIQALEWRKEFNRGGTDIGVARAVQLKNKERLSPSTVRRMHSFFSRHEVDKRATGFRRGEEGYPSAGRIAWGLWGGDAGQRWARRKVKQLDKEREENGIIWDVMTPCCDDCPPMEFGEIDFKAPVSAKIKKAIANKVKEHNDKHGDKKGKRVTQRMLEAVFRRGVGAYRTNPESVRPTVMGPDQWGLARVNAFLFAVRRGRFRSGKFDLDLLPTGHPLKSKK